jgi:hypothetical protein
MQHHQLAGTPQSCSTLERRITVQVQQPCEVRAHRAPSTLCTTYAQQRVGVHSSCSTAREAGSATRTLSTAAAAAAAAAGKGCCSPVEVHLEGGVGGDQGVDAQVKLPAPDQVGAVHVALGQVRLRSVVVLPVRLPRVVSPPVADLRGAVSGCSAVQRCVVGAARAGWGWGLEECLAAGAIMRSCCSVDGWLCRCARSSRHSAGQLASCMPCRLCAARAVVDAGVM